MVKNLPSPGLDPWVGGIPWRRKWLPLQYSCLENPMDRRAWWATVHGVTKSQTRLKRLSTHAHIAIWGLPRWSSAKEPSCQYRRCRRCRFNPWVRKIPWRGGMAIHSSILAWESYGQRSLVGTVHRVTNSWTQLKQLSTHACMQIAICVISSRVLISLRLLWSMAIILLPHFIFSLTWISY